MPRTTGTRSPATASATPSATLLRGEVDEVEALCGYERGRLAMLRPLLDVTRQMSLYPDASRVRELQVRLSDLIEAESAMLVERPALDVVAR